MSKQREKYLHKLQPKRQEKILETLKKIRAGKWEGLDIKTLSDTGKAEIRRCRVGDLRVVFEKRGERYVIQKMCPRGDVYKK